MRQPTPSFVGAIIAAIESRIVDVHTSLPARVEKYDATKQSASVKPLIKKGFTNEAGNRETESIPVITDVPIVFPGIGPYRITFPVNKGDTVLLIFSHASLDIWLAKGGEVDPKDDRHHTLADAIAVPGLRPFSNTSPASMDALVVESDAIKLGSNNADDPVALKSDLDELKQAIQNWIPAATDGGAALKIALNSLFVNWPKSSQKVKAE